MADSEPAGKTIARSDVSDGAALPIERTGVAIACLALVSVVPGAVIGALVAPRIDVSSELAIAIGALGAIVVAAPFARRLSRVLPVDLDGWFGRRRIAAALWSFVAVISVANSMRVTIFAADPSQSWAQMFPLIPDLGNHECFAAYVRAGELAAAGKDDLWIASDYQHRDTHTSAIVGLDRYLTDPYEYPPPFALLPRAAVAATDDYQDLRLGWFGLSALALMAAFLAIAVWTGGRAGASALLLMPVVAISIPYVVSLQFGQAHLVVIAAAVAGMMQLARGRPISGALLVGFATVTKIFPGLLVLHLLVRRRWRDAAFVTVAIVLFVAASAIVLGIPTLEAYVTGQVPRMASGEAFAFAETNPDNVSLYGLAYKLVAIGLLDGDGGASRELAIQLAWVWSAIAVVIVAIGSWRVPDRRGEVILWLGILLAGTLRSPFAPTYVNITTLWILALVIGRDEPRWWRTLLVALAWLLLEGTPPLFGPAGNAIAALPAQAISVGMAIWATVRAVRSVRSDIVRTVRTRPEP